MTHLLSCIESGAGMTRVAFVNADCANLARQHADYAQSLATADLVLPDGIGVKLGARWCGQDIRHNVNGTDLFPRLCQALERGRHSVYFLGARADVLPRLLEQVASRWPGLRIAGAQHGYFEAGQSAHVVRDIARSRAAVLLAGLGAPRQDVWLARHAADTGVRLAMGVGGLFDFYSGRLPRAPLWVREIGMEWAYRMVREPGRLWRRYLIGNTVFLLRVVASRHREEQRR